MFGNVKIGAKLYLLLGFLSVILVAIGMIGLSGMKTTNASLETVYANQLLPAVLLTQMDSRLHENMQELLLARLHDPKLPDSKAHEADHPVTKHTDKVAANIAENDRLWEQYLATYLTPEEKKLSERFTAQRQKYTNEGQLPALALFKERKFDEASPLVTQKLAPLYQDAQQSLRDLIQLQAGIAKETKAEADAAYARTRNLAIGGTAAGILLAMILGWWLIRGITGSVGGAASSISTSATEIAATIGQHERTASQQATASTETSATIDELAASARQSAEQAANAAAVAEKASTATMQGGDAAREAVAAMNGLKERIGAMAEQIVQLGEQTGQIGSIATLVKDLAAEINMLALNAAVEAARAGEHGKGFAVVAGEVRKLAAQSRKSAEQAAQLVGDIQKATHSTIMMTEEGARTVANVTDLAGKVAELFASISGMAGSVNENAQQVMLNARQQTAAFAQVVEAINSISAGAKETAAGIAQTKAGVQNLNQAAVGLKAIV